MGKHQVKKRALWVYEQLMNEYPDVGTFLTHDGPFQLLIAVILSAQCTDERINSVTPALFEAFPDAKAMAAATVDEIRPFIKSVTYFNSKAKNIHETAIILDRDYQGQVPDQLDQLVKLAGVGRKTANVVLGQAFGVPGITVDTHVNRLSRRLGFSRQKTAEKIEKDLMSCWEIAHWTDFSSILIVHGRQVCHSRKPNCEQCCLTEVCPRVGV